LQLYATTFPEAQKHALECGPPEVLWTSSGLAYLSGFCAMRTGDLYAWPHGGPHARRGGNLMGIRVHQSKAQVLSLARGPRCPDYWLYVAMNLHTNLYGNPIPTKRLSF